MPVLENETTTQEPAEAVPAARIGWYRWLICLLLFLATTVNYIDRQVIGVLKSTLQHDLHWTEC
jgi:ACS family hexuronate transporter-like MFS transporter